MAELKLDETKRPVYEKRYKDNGEEYLKLVDVIDIEEDLKEKSLEINRIKEIFNTQERLKAEELLDDLTNEEFLQELKDLTTYHEMDTIEFLNKTEELKSIYNKFPEEVRKKYNNLTKFSREYLPEFINKKTKELEEKGITIREYKELLTGQQMLDNPEHERIKENEKLNLQKQVGDDLQKQIEELKNKLNEKGAKDNV